MKHFKEIFGKVMVEITPVDVVMLGADVPVVTINGQNYADFVTWANKAFNPNLEFGYAYIYHGDCVVVAKINGVFHEKSASTLKANGITEWAIKADEQYEEDGSPIGCPALYLNISCIPDV